jgi:hypothetical protein
MKLNFRNLRVALWGILFGILVGAPFRLAEGTLETAEQAKADQKLFAQAQEIMRDWNKPGVNDQQAVQKLQSLTVDDIQWRNTDVQSALTDLTIKSKTTDSDHGGFAFVLHLPANIKQTDILGRAINNNVCIILPGKTSVWNLLNYISEQTNLSFEVQKGNVTMKLWEPGAYTWLDIDR